MNQDSGRRVCVVVPTRNRANLVSRTIESVFKQTYESLEVVVSNNASADNTSEELEKLRSSYPDMKIVEHEVLLDINAHWDLLIREYTSADYILILSDDDVLTDQNYLANAVRMFDKYPTVGVVFANYDIVDCHGDRLSSIKARFDDLISKEFFYKNFSRELFGIKGIGIPLLTALFKRSAYLDVGGYDLRCMSCDTHLWLKLLLFYDIGFVVDNVADYMVHAENISRSANLDYMFSDTLIPSNVKKLASERGCYSPEIRTTLDRMRKVFYANFHAHLIKNLLKKDLGAVSYLGRIKWIEMLPMLLSRIIRVSSAR